MKKEEVGRKARKRNFQGREKVKRVGQRKHFGKDSTAGTAVKQEVVNIQKLIYGEGKAHIA